MGETRREVAYRKAKELDVANKKIYGNVAMKNRMSPSQVEEIIKFTGKYVKNVLENGAYETVMLPLFGKFRPKVKQVQGMHQAQVRLKLTPPANEPVYSK